MICPCNAYFTKPLSLVPAHSHQSHYDAIELHQVPSRLTSGSPHPNTCTWGVHRKFSALWRKDKICYWWRFDFHVYIDIFVCEASIREYQIFGFCRPQRKKGHAELHISDSRLALISSLLSWCSLLCPYLSESPLLFLFVRWLLIHPIYRGHPPWRFCPGRAHGTPLGRCSNCTSLHMQIYAHSQDSYLLELRCGDGHCLEHQQTILWQLALFEVTHSWHSRGG